MSSLADQSANLTKTGEVFGSPRYMSPEQASGKRVDNRSDIYSLGIVMFEALTGSTPFTGNTTFELLASQISTLAPSILSKDKGLPPEIDAIVSKCLAKEPFERFHSMGELRKALLDVKAGKKVQKSGAGTNRWKQPETWLLASGVVLLIGVAASIGLLIIHLMKPADAPKPVQELEEIASFTSNGKRARAYILKNINNKVINFDKDIPASVDVNDEVLQEFDKTKVTEDLSMRGSTLKGPGLAHLIHLPLRSLALSTSFFSNRALKEISHMEKLEVLDLSGTNVDDEGLKQLAQLKHLKTLYLKGREKITNKGLANFAPLSNLETLNLSKDTWITGVGLGAIASLPSLRILRLDKSDIKDDDLVRIKELKNLKLLALRDTRIGDKGVDHLLNTQIQQLDLENTKITDKSLQSLVQMHALKELGLLGCHLSGEAVDELRTHRPDVTIYKDKSVPWNNNHDNQ